MKCNGLINCHKFLALQSLMPAQAIDRVRPIQKVSLVGNLNPYLIYRSSTSLATTFTKWLDSLFSVFLRIIFAALSAPPFRCLTNPCGPFRVNPPCPAPLLNQRPVTKYTRCYKQLINPVQIFVGVMSFQVNRLHGSPLFLGRCGMDQLS